MSASTLNSLKKIIKDISENFINRPVDLKDIKPESRFVEDLGFDSLSSLELIILCEESFGFDIPDKRIDRICTVQDMASCINEYIG